MGDQTSEAAVAAIVRRVLGADRVDAERALGVLMRTIMVDFVKARGGAGSGRNVMGKPNALDGLLHALITQIQHGRESLAQPGAGADASLAKVQESLCEIASECLRLAEEQLDAPPERPIMRIVE